MIADFMSSVCLHCAAPTMQGCLHLFCNMRCTHGKRSVHFSGDTLLLLEYLLCCQGLESALLWSLALHWGKNTLMEHRVRLLISKRCKC